MKRWECREKKDVERSDVDLFLKEVIDVCEKHGLSISHEDSHGGFIVTKYSKDNAKWLMEALVDTGERENI